MFELWKRSALAATLFGVIVTCGCGGGGSGVGSNTVIDGNVATASTAAAERGRRHWLARLGEEILILARTAYAQVADTSLAGIDVTVSGTGGTLTDTTDVNGAFSIGGAPNGDVVAQFRRGSCTGQVSLPDVTGTSTVTLENLIFNCSETTPARVSETFQGVALNVPASANGNFTVCVSSGGISRNRVVKIQGATFENQNGNTIPFGDLLPGDRLLAIGAREELGASSTLAAATVRILGSGSPSDCSGAGFGPTATPTRTPAPTATGATSTGTPTSTPTATPTQGQ
jgi:hypothetical protein